MRFIKIYKNRCVLYFKPEDALKFDNYIAETGIDKNFLVDRAIREFIENKIPLVKEIDGRNLEYDGQNKTDFRYTRISDITQAILEIKTKECKVSRSSLGVQAVLHFIDMNE